MSKTSQNKLYIAILVNISVLTTMVFLCFYQFDITMASLTKGAEGSDKIIYVALDGDADNSGSELSPFASIDQANSYIKTKLNNGEYGEYIVMIEQGTYYNDDKITFDSSYSKESSVTYKGIGEVTLSGGIAVTSDMRCEVPDTIKNRIISTDAKSNVIAYDLSSLGLFADASLNNYGSRGFGRLVINGPRELIVNGESQKISMWNDTDKYALGAVSDGDSSNAIVTVGDRASLWTSANDFYIHGYLNNGFADDTIKIDSVINNTQIMLAHKGQYALAPREGVTFYNIINLLEEISVEGEYYIDSQEQKLFWYPPSNIDVSKASVEISNKNDLFMSFREANNIKIDNINFINARNSGIYIEGGENNTITNCEFRNLGIVAIQFGFGGHRGGTAEEYEKLIAHEGLRYFNAFNDHYSAADRNGGKNHTVSNSIISDIGAGGIVMAGGDRKTLEPANNIIEDCEITRVNKFEKAYKPAVYLSGVGNIVRNNYIHDMTGQAILLHGNNHIIEYNNIDKTVTEISDQGAIYQGRNITIIGNVIRHNIFSNITKAHPNGHPVSAIFFDDASGFNAIEGNIFYNINGGTAAIRYNTGGNSSISNNILVNVPYGICSAGSGKNLNFGNGYDQMHNTDGKWEGYAIYRERMTTTDIDNMRGVDYNSDVYRNAYPYLYNVYTYNTDYSIGYKNMMAYNNIDLEIDDFIDFNKGNFALKDGVGKNISYDLGATGDVIMQRTGIYSFSETANEFSKINSGEFLIEEVGGPIFNPDLKLALGFSFGFVLIILIELIVSKNKNNITFLKSRRRNKKK